MGLLDTITETFKASTEATARGDATEPSEGAYWCHDCSERILDTKVDGDEPPECPQCGDEMEFERSPDSAGCAC